MANKYVDLSATNNGDGTAANQAASGGAAGAWNSLATMIAGVSSGDVVYIRRVTATSTLAVSTSVPAGVTVVGWPKSGDVLYSGRPSSGTSNGWDADGADYPDWTYTSAATGLVVAANNVTLDRLKVFNSASSGSPVCFSHTAGSNLSVTNCYFENTNTTATPTHACVKATPGATVTAIYRNCTIKIDRTNSGNGSLLTINGQCVFYDTTLILTNATSTTEVYPVLVQANATNGALINTTLTVGTASGSTESFLSIATAFTVKNFTVTHTTRTGTSNNGPALLVSGNGCVIQGFASSLGGYINIIGGGNEIEISEWTQRQANTSGGIQVTGAGNIISVNRTSFLSGNTAGDIAISSGAYGTTVLARGTSFVAGMIAAANNGSRMYSFDHNQTANNLRMQFYNGNIIASTVYRSSGESFSLQATPNDAATGYCPMMVISPRGRESIWLALTSGAHTITMYFACKNISPDAGDVWLESEYKDNNHKPVIVSSHDPGTALTSDSSTWNGDSGLTVFKVALSFTLPSDQAVPVRVFFGKYAASAYFYLDPKPEVT